MDGGGRYVTDFEAIIEALRRAGLKLQAISDQTGIPRGSLINYLLEGMTPRHPNGETLIVLYCRVLNATREQVPTRLAVPSAHARSRGL